VTFNDWLAPAPAAVSALAPESPLYRQLYAGIRRAISDGQMAAGTRLPSTRILAQQLGVSRNTVMAAYDQLLAEGYLDARTGRGTYVSTVMSGSTAPKKPPRIARQGVVPERLPEVGVPALECFPVKSWTRLVTRRVKCSMAELMSNAHPTGYRPLREAIAVQLGMTRGLSCRAEQIFVLPGFDAVAHLVSRALLGAGDKVWIEDPCSPLARAAFANSMVSVVNVPVNRDGFDVNLARQIAPGARLACVTPERQFPLGTQMSPARRNALLAWARNEQGWILEDDRASELNWAAAPLSTLARADGVRRVLYAGSFDRVMYPALRICYVVVPESAVAAFTLAWADSMLHCPVLEQAALTDFITGGHFALHLRRMRALYADRSNALSNAMAPEIDTGVRLISTEGGLFSTALFSGALDRDVVLDAFTAEEALHVRPLSSFCAHSQWNGVVVGFGAIEKGNLRAMIRRLTASVRSLS